MRCRLEKKKKVRHGLVYPIHVPVREENNSIQALYFCILSTLSTIYNVVYGHDNFDLGGPVMLIFSGEII